MGDHLEDHTKTSTGLQAHTLITNPTLTHTLFTQNSLSLSHDLWRGILALGAMHDDPWYTSWICACHALTLMPPTLLLFGVMSALLRSSQKPYGMSLLARLYTCCQCLLATAISSAKQQPAWVGDLLPWAPSTLDSVVLFFFRGCFPLWSQWTPMAEAHVQQHILSKLLATSTGLYLRQTQHVPLTTFEHLYNIAYKRSMR